MSNATTTGEETMTDLPIGTRIYNHGDMANVPHFGIIIDKTRFGYRIKTDSPNSYVYTIPVSMIWDKFLGHSGTRIVTEDEYIRYQEDDVAYDFNPLKQERSHNFDQMIVTEYKDTRTATVEITSESLVGDLGEDGPTFEYESAVNAFDSLLDTEGDLKRCADRVRQDIEDAQQRLTSIRKAQARVHHALADLDLFI